MIREIFESHHKVRTFECDSYGHVNNAVYLNYLELGRMETLERKGFTLEKLKNMGALVIIRRIAIDYKYPAKAGDRLVIRTHMKNHRSSSGIFHQEIYREPDNRLIARADVTWAFTNLEGRPIPIPPVVRRAFQME